jgi:hypothetical protein
MLKALYTFIAILFLIPLTAAAELPTKADAPQSLTTLSEGYEVTVRSRRGYITIDYLIHYVNMSIRNKSISNKGVGNAILVHLRGAKAIAERSPVASKNKLSSALNLVEANTGKNINQRTGTRLAEHLNIPINIGRS